MTLVINLQQKLHRVDANWLASARPNKALFARKNSSVVRKNNPKGSKVLGFNDFSYQFGTKAP